MKAGDSRLATAAVFRYYYRAPIGELNNTEVLPMRRLVWLVPAILFGFLNADAKTIDRIVAQVNDDIITMSEMNRQMAPVRSSLEAKFSGQELERELEKAEKELLEGMIQEKLLYQKAVELGFDTDIEPKISSEVQSVMKERGIGSTEELETILEQQNMTMRELRDMYRRKILVEGIVYEFIGSRITVLTPEIERYYKEHLADFSTPEEVSLSELIVTGETDKEAQDRANDIHRRLVQGESFATLASQYSKGPTGNKGGAIGTYLISKLNPDTLNAIAGLNDGEVSTPRKAGEGYIIYRVDARKLITVKPLEEVRGEIAIRLRDRKYAPELARYVAQLKEDAYIQYFSETK